MSPSLDIPPVSFHEAVARFRSLLRANNRPEVVVWIDAGDVVAFKSRLHVQLRIPAHRWMQAQCRYELGLDRKLGVALQLVCEAPGLSCCHVYLPRNREDAAGRSLEGGLRFVFPEETRPAHGVTNRVYWAWLSMRGQQDPFRLKA